MNINWIDNCKTVRAFQEKMLEHDLLHSCVNCCHYDFKADKCIKFNMKPPVDVLVFSCGADWCGNIPF